MAGHAVPLLNFRPHGEVRYTLDEAALRGVLENADLQGLPVMVFSVAGLARKGKSFLLNFVVSYLEHLERGIDEEWNHLTTRLNAFTWNSGMERVTIGIQMWNRPFVITCPDGTRVGILVMDTQGTFDRNARHAECASIFALSTLISSLPVYNIMREVNESDLQHLYLFSAFARAVGNDHNAEPFQKLLFLLRDWSYPNHHAYGTDGGTAYINRVLEIDRELQEEHIQLRNDLRDVFDTISGFNMPRPGKVVEEDGGEGIDLNDLDPNFVNHLKQFLGETFAPDSLVLKTIGHHLIRSDHLLRRILGWAECFGGQQLPEIRSIYQHTISADDDMALEIALREFKRNFNDYIRINNNWDTEVQQLRAFFENEREVAHQAYLEAPGLGNSRERRENNFDFLDRRLLEEFVDFMEAALLRRPVIFQRQNRERRDVLQTAIAIAQAAAPALVSLILFRRPL